MDSGLPPLPRFPGKPDTMMTSPALLEERRAALETYLNTILQSDTYRENPEMVRAMVMLLLELRTIVPEDYAKFYHKGQAALRHYAKQVFTPR